MIKKTGDATLEFAGMKFIKTKFTSIDGSVVIAYTEESQLVPFVRIEPSGIFLSSGMTAVLSDETDVQDFAEFFSMIVKDARSLKKRLHSTLAGH